MEKKEKIILTILVILIAFFCSYLVKEQNLAAILAHLPDILGILLAGVLASLAILFGLLSDQDLSKIRRRNIERTGNKTSDDHFVKFLKTVKNDTLIIFSSFVVTFFLAIIPHMESSKINPSLPSIISSSPINPTVILLTLGLSLFILSISATYDIIVSVFLLNQERYLSSVDEVKKK